MKIKELFNKCTDVELLLKIYTTLSIITKSEIDDSKMEVDLKSCEEDLHYVVDTFNAIKNCESTVCKNELTLFLYNDVFHKVYIAGISDEEAISMIDKNFSVWNDTGECRLHDYDDFVKCSNKEIAGFMIADKSVDDMGIYMCCASILISIMSYGVTEKIRFERNEAISNFAQGGKYGLVIATPHGVITDFEKIAEMFPQSAEYDEIPESLTRVEDAIDDYRYKVVQERLVKTIKTEYKNRMRIDTIDIDGTHIDISDDKK